MLQNQSFRSFKGGSWDLRQRERRQVQELRSAPDRRLLDRRATMDEIEPFETDLTWVNKPRLDE